ncbi:MAG: hypothetical protein U0R44_04370 [Candidatus Micrarchaeia archaeon]
MRAFCGSACLDFLLRNTDPKNERGFGMAFDLSLEQEAFLSIANPKLIVVFQCENVFAPFSVQAMAAGSIFSDSPPMIERAN